MNTVNKWMRIWMSLFLSAGLCLFFGLSSIQAESILTQKTGSLEIIVHDEEGTPIPGGSLTRYHVADIAEEKDGPYFHLTEDFEKSDASLTDPQNRQVIAYLEDYAIKNKVKGDTFPVPNDARVCFQDLPVGLYLIVQSEAAPGYEAMPSFLISIPNYEDGKYVYEVSAYPKSDPKRLETPSTPETPKQEPSRKPNTNTAAETNPMLWIGLCLVAVSGLLLIVFKTRKQDETDSQEA